MTKNVTSEYDDFLWANFLSGDDEAFKIIYDSHIQVLFKYGCHFTLDDNLVQDCIQDLFIDLHHYRSNIGKTNNIKLYLFVSLKRKIIKKLELMKKIKSIDINSLPFNYSLIASDDIDNDLNKNRIEYLEKAMEELSPRQKEAIYLKFVVELSYEELCDTLHLSYQSARNLVYRGLEKLRESCNKNYLFLWFLLLQNTAQKKK